VPGVELCAEQVGADLSVPGSTPRSCIKSANISAPTTDAALLRVTVERSTPNAAMPVSGSV
jgi:hypothetical protein